MVRVHQRSTGVFEKKTKKAEWPPTAPSLLKKKKNNELHAPLVREKKGPRAKSGKYR